MRNIITALLLVVTPMAYAHTIEIFSVERLNTADSLVWSIDSDRLHTLPSYDPLKDDPKLNASDAARLAVSHRKAKDSESDFVVVWMALMPIDDGEDEGDRARQTSHWFYHVETLNADFMKSMDDMETRDSAVVILLDGSIIAPSLRKEPAKNGEQIDDGNAEKPSGDERTP